MANIKAVLIEGTEINDKNADEKIDEIVAVLFGEDAEEGNAEPTSPEE